MEIKPPELEVMVGMEVYKSRGLGIGGVIKQLPEDFIVEEITPEGKVLELSAEALPKESGPKREFVHYTLQKYNWDTMKAAKEIAKRLHVSHKRMGFAGTKDKRALTVQRMSAWNTAAEDIADLRIKDMEFRDITYGDFRINLGDLKGNRFTVAIRDLPGEAAELKEKVQSIIGELRSQVPSFYGVQRFGTIRPLTHLVGREIVRGNFREAVMTYLTKDYEGENPETRDARRLLAENSDFREALMNFPKHLGYENALMNHLINAPEDFIGALKVLPKNLSMMFVHAYQSYIYNRSLSEYLRKKIPVEKLPLTGFETRLDEITAKILSEEGIETGQFRVKDAPQLGSKGEYRECHTPVEGLWILECGTDELNEGKNKLTLRFSLPKGNYATVLLREIMKN
ncbi:MAG: tRNA pseudouridine(13) synthase TruD [Candidatus Altiarchaeota archaeon]|nr:tRNA pseudouridine(13) synthase TruD [Candidatus Altiarchaeota archaeon]